MSMMLTSLSESSTKSSFLLMDFFGAAFCTDSLTRFNSSVETGSMRLTRTKLAQTPRDHDVSKDRPAAVMDGPTAVMDGLAAVMDGPAGVTDGPAVVVDGSAVTKDKRTSSRGGRSCSGSG
ncbi:hypothetical protein PoB_003290000 [Plakobranchus ocellatus]|uniref:Uncharacterized protein n=1 Tax=Plakobranchus ocellatus TaxID=259542 RepID=A0AAV4AG84_9GAST|nr:hypothetical protein PoB_003290000 [Plakobranchus ocellatus]